MYGSVSPNTACVEYHLSTNLMVFLCKFGFIYIHVINFFINDIAATRQNNKVECAPSEDTDQSDLSLRCRHGGSLDS